VATSRLRTPKRIGAGGDFALAVRIGGSAMRSSAGMGNVAMPTPYACAAPAALAPCPGAYKTYYDNKYRAPGLSNVKIFACMVKVEKTGKNNAFAFYYAIRNMD